MRLHESLKTAMLIVCVLVMAWAIVVMIYQSPLAFLGLVCAGAAIIYLALQ